MQKKSFSRAHNYDQDTDCLLTELLDAGEFGTWDEIKLQSF